MRASKYRKKIDKKVKKILLGSAAGLVAAGLLFFFLYFKVDYIEVMGSSHYTEEEIKEMTLRGPLAENSVLAPLLYSKDNVQNIPFVKGFEVSRINRNTLCISVKEKQPVGCIPFLDSYMYFDRTGTIIESAVEKEETIPYFEGIQVKSVAMGEKLPVENDTVLNTAITLARIFEKNENIPDHINFNEQYEISLIYGDITVELGKDKFLEDKMARMIAILPKLEGQKGVLHMENVSETSKVITFESEKTPTGEETENSSGKNGENNTEDTSDTLEKEEESQTDLKSQEDPDGDSYEEGDTGVEGSADEIDQNTGSDDQQDNEDNTWESQEDPSLTDEGSSYNGRENWESQEDNTGQREDGYYDENTWEE